MNTKSDTSRFITIAGFENFTAQHVFDMSARHLLSQKVRACGAKPHRPGDEGLYSANTCLYDGPNGTTCAAGIFIRPEERHDADYGNSNWNSLVSRGQVPPKHKTLIRQLQLIHDATDDSIGDSLRVQQWAQSLRSLAKSLGLNEDAIDEMLTGS